jgi:large repetitive protein
MGASHPACLFQVHSMMGINMGNSQRNRHSKAVPWIVQSWRTMLDHNQGRVRAKFLAWPMLAAIGISIVAQAAGVSFTTPLVNTATVTPPAGTSNPGTSCTAAGGNYNSGTGACSASDSDVIGWNATISKTVAGPAIVGQAFNYTIGIGNAATTLTGGFTTAAIPAGTVLTITEAVPLGLTVNNVSASTGVSAVTCAPTSANGAATMTCTVTTSAALPSGTVATANTVSLLVNATASTAGSLTNSASIDPTGGTNPQPPTGCTPTTSCSSAPTTVNPAPKLTTTKTASVNPLRAGNTGQSYIITINIANGPTLAPIVLSDALPTGITTSGAVTATGGTLSGCPGATPGATSLGAACSIAAGATNPVVVTIPITVGNAAIAGGGTNTVNVSGGGDPTCTTAVDGCDATTPSTPVIPSVYSSKTVSNSPLIVGGTGQYYMVEVSVTGGPSTAPIVVADALPTGITLSGAVTATGGTLSGCPTAAGGTSLGASCQIATGISGPVWITIPVNVGATAVQGIGAGGGTNSANLSGGGDTSCTSATGNACDSSINVDVSLAPAIISVVKTGTPVTTTGGAISYTLNATNSGPSPSGTNLIVQDLVPAGEIVTGVSGGSCTGLPFTGNGTNILSCTIPGPIAAGGSAALTLTATAPTTVGLITNYSASNPTGDGTTPVQGPGPNCTDTPTNRELDWGASVTGAPLPQSFSAAGRTITYSYRGALASPLIAQTSSVKYPANSYATAAGNSAFLTGLGNQPTATAPATPYDVVVTFSVPVQNLRFSVFDLDGSVGGYVSAADSAGVAQTVTLTSLKAASPFVSVTSTPPTAPSFLGAAGGWDPTTNTNSAQTSGVNVLVAGTVKTITFHVATSVLNGDTNIYYSALIFDEPASTSCSSATTQVTTPASIVTTKVLTSVNGAAPGASVKSGDVLIYTIKSTNSGGTSGTTSLTETVPAQTKYNGPEVDAGPTVWTGCVPGTTTNPSTCTTTQTVPANGSASSTFTVKVNTPATAGTTTNVVTSSADTTCSACTVPTTIAAPKVGVTKTSNGAWTVGQAGATYTLTVTNTGGAATVGAVTVLDTLPTGITANWTSPTTFNGWSCSFASQAVTCTSSAVLAATTGTSTIANLPVNVLAAAVPTVTNVASAGGGGDPFDGGSTPAPGSACTALDSATPGHCASAPTTVNTPASVATVKAFTAGPTATANANQYTVTYTLTTKNSGGTATTYGLTDTPHFGAGVTINSATCSATGVGADTTTCSGGALALTNGSASNVAVAGTSIGAGVSHVYTIVATVTLSPASVTSASSGTGCDTTPPASGTAVGFNNAATTTPAAGGATTTNTCKPLPANVTLIKSASPTTVTVGGAVVYTLTATNTGGTATGTSVVVQELVPTGVTINTATAGTGVTSVACGTPIVGDGSTVKTCTLTLPAGGIAANGGTAIFTLNGTATAAGNPVTNYVATNPADGNTPPPSPPGAGCNATTTSCANAPITISGVVVANPDNATTPFNTAVTTNVVANDTSTGSPLNPASVTPTQPTHGTVVCNSPTAGSCIYTPTAGYTGSDGYTYQVCDSEPTPVCASTTVSVQVGPHAVNDTGTTPQNTPLNGNVSTNDTYPSGSTFSDATQPANGTVTVNNDGTYTYTPTSGYSGPDSFTYKVCEGNPFQTLCSTATVNITVGTNGVVANPDTATTSQNTAVKTAVITNDTTTGAPLNPASVTPTVQPAHGTVACDATGSCTYTPATNYAGPDQYTYQVCDTSTPTPVCATAVVSVTVQPNVVTANPDTATTGQNTPVTTPVISNDTVSATGAPLNPASVTPTQPTNGTVSCDATGKCTYTPNPNYSGPDQYTYQVCDESTPTVVCSSTTVSVTVGANLPVANPDTGTTPYATPVTTNVVANDTTTGAPLNPASVTVTTPPAQGSVVCNNPTAGSCVYTPPVGFSGQAVYTYQVCDTSTPTPVCVSSTVTIQVGPKANNDVSTTPQNTAVNGNASTNDTYPSGSVFSEGTGPTQGTLVFNADGTYTYTPDPNYSGPDSFTYTVCEPTPNQALCSTATVNITVNGNQPVANPDSATTPFNTAVTTNVIANDTTTGAPLNPASVTPTQPAHGTVTCDATGSCTYTPTTGYSGPDQYTYKVCDESTPTPVCAMTTVSVQVGPNAVNDAASTAQNTAVNGNVSTNDTYPAGSTFTGLAPPSHGTVTVNADGTYTYTPATNFSGTDTFTYTVCEAMPNQTLCSTATVTVTVGSNVPVANPDSATTPQNTAVTTSVLTNDTTTGAPLNPASVTPTVQPAHGTVTCDTSGNCTYTPATNYAGPDQYTYQVCDTTTPTPVCATAVVSVTVQPNVVTANPDTATTAQNTAVSTPVTTNDTVLPNGAPLNPASVTPTVQPAHGTVTCAAGSCTYIPAAGYSGSDQYTYKVCDNSTPTPVCGTAVVTVTVGTSTVVANPDTATTPFNTPVTVNVIANDTTSGAPLNPSVTPTTQPAHGTATCDAAGNCTYTPNAGYAGNDSYTYTVCDTSSPTPQCAITTVAVQVGPDAVHDVGTTPINTPLNGNVASNDVYPAGATFAATSQPSHGTVILNTNGTYTYTPASNFSGADTFGYTVCEASPFQALCSAATVTITVNGIGPAPQPDNATTPFNTPVTTSVLMNDTTTGAPLNPASVTVATPPTHGSATCDSSGNCTYTPTTGFTGTDTYTYQVCDTTTPTPNCATAVVTVVVGPQANPDTLTVPQGTPGTGNVATNDIYPTGSTFTVTTQPPNGTVVMQPTGGYTYTPTGTFTGTDTFTYTVCEPAPNNTLCATSTVTVTVSPNLFDPPFITKSASAVDAQTLLWTIVVDNYQNASAQNSQIRDPLPAGMNFVSGQVTCQAFGSSSVSSCSYDAANNRILADVLLQSDLGNTNQATAPNRVVITFQARYTTTPVKVTNIASACWDSANSATNITACATAVSGTAVYTPQGPPTPPVAVPVASRWMLMLLATLLATLGAGFALRRKAE